MPNRSVSPGGHRQSPIARGMYWSTQVSSLAFEMVFPVGVGLWLDKQLGCLPWLTVVGAIVGFTLLMLHLIALTKPKPARQPSRQSSQTGGVPAKSPSDDKSET